jgi:hypothetical protein
MGAGVTAVWRLVLPYLWFDLDHDPRFREANGPSK